MFHSNLEHHLEVNDKMRTVLTATATNKEATVNINVDYLKLWIL